MKIGQRTQRSKPPVKMKKLLLAIFMAISVIVAIVGYVRHRAPSFKPTAQRAAQDDTALADAFRNHARNVQVQGRGVVTKLLADDNDGSRHQRFVLRISTGQTLLIAHNIDLAPRLTSLSQGDTVEFNGLYEWNPEGGVVHWTHHDPSGQHQAGWLKHNGQTFQ